MLLLLLLLPPCCCCSPGVASLSAAAASLAAAAAAAAAVVPVVAESSLVTSTKPLYYCKTRRFRRCGKTDNRDACAHLPRQQSVAAAAATSSAGQLRRRQWYATTAAARGSVGTSNGRISSIIMTMPLHGYLTITIVSELCLVRRHSRVTGAIDRPGGWSSGALQPPWSRI